MIMQSQGMRKTMATKYPERNPNYSPSVSYNYSPQSGFSGSNPANARRRPDQFRKDPQNNSERLMRQNDIIIKLLKEIRDRLPKQAESEADPVDQTVDTSVVDATTTDIPAAADAWNDADAIGNMVDDTSDEIPVDEDQPGNE
jgi:hypothetical protein